MLLQRRGHLLTKPAHRQLLRVLGNDFHWRPIEPLSGHAKLNKCGSLKGISGASVRMANRRRCGTLFPITYWAPARSSKSTDLFWSETSFLLTCDQPI